jgi:hypothetical protein
VSFSRDGATATHVIEASIGDYRDGRWVVRQRLNGDETQHGEEFRFPALATIAGVSFGEVIPGGRAARAELYDFS